MRTVGTRVAQTPTRASFILFKIEDFTRENMADFAVLSSSGPGPGTFGPCEHQPHKGVLLRLREGPAL